MKYSSVCAIYGIVKNDNDQDFRKAFFLLCAATAFKISGLNQKSTPRNDLFTTTPTHTISQQVDNNHELTVHECKELQAKIADILTTLEISHLENQPAIQQKQAADKILHYILNTTQFLSDEDDESDKRKTDKTINSAYKLLCHDICKDTSAESTALSLLYQASGLNNQRVKLEKDISEAKIDFDVVLIDFADGQHFCSPIETRIRDGINKQKSAIDDEFFTVDDYRQKHKDYHFSKIENSDMLNTYFNFPVAENTCINESATMER